MFDRYVIITSKWKIIGFLFIKYIECKTGHL